MEIIYLKDYSCNLVSKRWIGLARQELLPADFGGYIVHGSNKIESRHLP